MAMEFYVANIVNGEYVIPYGSDVRRAFNTDADGNYIGPNYAYCRDLDVGFSTGNTDFLMALLNVKIKDGVTHDIDLNEDFIKKVDDALDQLYEAQQFDDWRRMNRIKIMAITGLYKYNATVMYGA